MTAVDVDALAKLREAATGGPWEYGITGIYADGLAEVGRVGSTDDAALIVAAVNALPDLLAEVRRGRALREAVDGLAAEWSEMARDHGEQGASNTALVYVAHARHLRAAVGPS